MKTVWDIAYDLHKGSIVSYEEQLAFYMSNGYIFSTPSSLVWAEAVEDVWMIYLMVGKGSIPSFINAIPYWLPRFGYTRFLLRNEHSLRIGSMERICKFYSLDVNSLKNRTK